MSDSEPTVVSKSLQSLKRWWSHCDEVISWSNLSIYGNNPIVKLAILAPFVAQVIIHKAQIPYLTNYQDHSLGWLYAALMCFFFAQLIYNFRCHRDIKDYPSEIKFTQAMEATTPDSDLNLGYFDVYKLHFKRYGGAIDQDKYGPTGARHYATIQDMRVVRIDGFDPSMDQHDKAQESIDNIIQGAQIGQQFNVVDWKLLGSLENSSLSKMFQTDKFEGDSYRTSRETDAVIKMIGEARKEFNSSHWRAKAIKRGYTKLNLNRLIFRLIAATLYTAGTLYFIYAGVSNIVKVLVQYGWLEKLPSILSHL